MPTTPEQQPPRATTTVSSDMPPATAEHSLVRALGVWALAASIVNVTVGGGIFRLPATVATSLGAAAPLAYVVCAVAMGLIVLCFAEAGSRVALTGGPYAYVEVAFGPFVGFMAGVLLWLLGTFAVAAVSTIFADSLGALVPALQGAGPRSAVLVVVFALLAWVNARGVRQGTRLNTVATVAKLLPLLLLVAVGLFAAQRANLAIPEMPAADSVARASILLIFAFSGIESALVPSGEVASPARTVPRAIGIAMVGITLLYLALHTVAQGVLGPELAGHPTPLAEAAGRSIAPWARSLILVGAVVSMFGYVSGMTLAVPRALYAFGRDGFLPRAVGRVHPVHRTPDVAIWVQSAIACALAISGQFEKLAIIANLATLILYGACCVAAWQLRRRNIRLDEGRPMRVPIFGIAPLLALAVIAYMLSSITLDEWAVVLGVLVLAAAIFAITRGRRRELAAGAPRAAA